MASPSSIFYQSSYGDRWILARRQQDGALRVFHVAGAASGGSISAYHVGAFLGRDPNSPAKRALLELIGHVVSEDAQTLIDGLLAAKIAGH